MSFKDKIIKNSRKLALSGAFLLGLTPASAQQEQTPEQDKREQPSDTIRNRVITTTQTSDYTSTRDERSTLILTPEHELSNDTTDNLRNLVYNNVEFEECHRMIEQREQQPRKNNPEKTKISYHEKSAFTLTYIRPNKQRIDLTKLVNPFLSKMTPEENPNSHKKLSKKDKRIQKANDIRIAQATQKMTEILQKNQLPKSEIADVSKAFKQYMDEEYRYNTCNISKIEKTTTTQILNNKIISSKTQYYR